MTRIHPYDHGLTITNEALRVTVAPDLGASVLEFESIAGDASVPILRRTPNVIEGAFDCSMQVMLPWVNRISGGGIRADGQFHPLEPNLPNEAFPNHGNGFQSAWTVAAHAKTSISMALHSIGPGPYVYYASYDLRLDDASLVARLEIRNRSKLRLPYGAGFHPWFERHAGISLQAAADRVWLEDPRYIPTEPVSIDAVPDFDFRSGNALPRRWINNSFTGWDGIADIDWPEQGIRLRIRSPGTGCYHVYSPGPEASFFCFETETHIPDAANLVPETATGAPAWLRQSEVLVHETRFEVLRQPGDRSEN